MFCRPCVYKDGGSKCPSCDALFPTTGVKLNRILRQLFEDQHFKCVICDATYRYSDHEAHMNRCLESFRSGLPCLYKEHGCTARLQNGDEFKEHVSSVCRFAQLNCNICEETILRKEEKQHNCGKKLLTKI